MKLRLAILCSVAMLSGCAGWITPFINNPYAGNYDGTFVSSDGHKGTINAQLTKLGNVFGTLHDTTNNKSGSLNGSVDTSLKFNATIDYPGVVSEPVTGTLNSDHNIITGKLIGSKFDYTLTLTEQ